MEQRQDEVSARFVADRSAGDLLARRDRGSISRAVHVAMPAAAARASVHRAPLCATNRDCPRRHVSGDRIMQILLDPRSIQWLLGSGGVLLTAAW